MIWDHRRLCPKSLTMYCIVYDSTFTLIYLLHSTNKQYKLTNERTIERHYTGSSEWANNRVILTCIVYLDSNIGTMSLKPICLLIKCTVVTTPINDASSCTFFLCALPASTSAGTRCMRLKMKGTFWRLQLSKTCRHIWLYLSTMLYDTSD